MANKIQIPNNNVNERTYILHYLFTNVLGIQITIEVSDDVEDYVIELHNSKTIIIKDYFFNLYQKDLTYLTEKNIPTAIYWYTDTTYINEQVPVIYGESEITDTEHQIVSKIDIFAASFFMLTRWEEHVLHQHKDKHGRFDESKSLSVQFNFFKLPVVNIYIELLWNIITSAGFQADRKKINYKVKITHDVDQLYRYDTLKKIAKALIGDVVSRKKPLLTIVTIKDAVKSLINKKHDPYNTFQYLMKCSEKHGLSSHFYFIPSELNEFDARYSISSDKAKEIIQQIIQNKHHVGIHGSWNSFENSDVFHHEYNRLAEYTIKEGRQHYLRFNNPITWQIWEDNNLEIDSTVGFSGRNGFRAGICYEYPVFHILQRKQLNLIESPLIFMEGALGYNNDPEKFIEELRGLSLEVKKYGGIFVFLWHPNNLWANEWKKVGKYYEKYLETICS